MIPVRWLGFGGETGPGKICLRTSLFAAGGVCSIKPKTQHDLGCFTKAYPDLYYIAWRSREICSPTAPPRVLPPEDVASIPGTDREK